MTVTTLLMRGGAVHTGAVPGDTAYGDEGATAVAVEGGRIVFVGNDDAAQAYDGAATVVDLHGALIAPAFVDAHVHTVQSGFLRTHLDLSATTSLTEVLVAVAAHAGKNAGADAILVGTGWDDSAWPERRAPLAAELEAAAPGRSVLLTRLDGHSAVLSPALMLRIDGLAEQNGYDPHGHMTLDAMAHTSAAMAALIGPEERLAAARAGVAAYADQGIAAFHEAAAPHIGPAYEIDLVRRAAAEAGLLPTFYWGVHLALDEGRALGARGLAGDLNADGSIGSRTASLRTPYDDRPGHAGHPYLSAEQIAEHLVVCTRAGVQGGFHCIGDAGIDAITDGFRLAEAEVGAQALRAAGHRLEHVEMPTAATLAMMADLGVQASMQPLFDALWGGPDQMYAERLGARWRGMNPIGAMHRAGINVALGSDTPVTVSRPWRAIAAACRHHECEQRVDRATAFRMHTQGGWRAAGEHSAGVLAVGAPAHVAVWRTELDGTLPPVDVEPRLCRLVVGGRTVRELDPDG